MYSILYLVDFNSNNNYAKNHIQDTELHNNFSAREEFSQGRFSGFQENRYRRLAGAKCWFSWFGWSNYISRQAWSRRNVYWSRASVCLSVCLSLAAFPHYCKDPDVTWENGRGCSLFVHYRWICNRCTGFVAMTTHRRTRNVSECFYSFSAWFQLLSCYSPKCQNCSAAKSRIAHKVQSSRRSTSQRE